MHSPTKPFYTCIILKEQETDRPLIFNEQNTCFQAFTIYKCQHQQNKMKKHALKVVSFHDIYGVS